LEGLVPEAVGIIFTVLIIDQLNRRRATNERKLELFDQAKSRSNDMAVDALEKIQRAGWWDEMLEHYLNDARRIDLSQVQWSGGVDLSHKNLSGADLDGANLEGANLGYANLERADLDGANLEGANLQGANLSGVILRSANLSDANLESVNLQGSIIWGGNLKGADLASANLSDAIFLSAHLQGANLFQANLSGATVDKTAKFDNITALPDPIVIHYDEEKESMFLDIKYWTPGTDMSRYTNPNHPDFWQPDWAKPDDTD